NAIRLCISRSAVEAHILQPDLSAGYHLAVVGSRDDHLPQLLGGALMDRLGDDLDAATSEGAEEVGGVVDADSELTAIEHRRRGTDAGGALDRRGVGAAMDHPPRRVLLRTELDPRDHSVRTDRLERHAERPEEGARLIEAG